MLLWQPGKTWYRACSGCAAADIPRCIAGITAFHEGIRAIPPQPRMADNRTPWGLADRWCWDAHPAYPRPLHSQLQPYVERLYALRRPIAGLRDQLIHADPNPENILVAPGVPPALIDMAPFWRPPEFALAIFANWNGPRQGDGAVLASFAGIREFNQLLVRAAIRMLLVMAVIDQLDNWATCSEKRAAEIVIEYVARLV